MTAYVAGAQSVEEHQACESDQDDDPSSIRPYHGFDRLSDLDVVRPRAADPGSDLDSMRSDEYASIFALERQHWWYAGMRAITAALLSRHRPAASPLSVLDVGCGTGYALGWLADDLGLQPAVGIDASPDAARFWTGPPRVRAARASVDRLPFGAGQFDALTCFEVVYQLERDDACRAWSEMHRVLKRGGLLCVREPAFDWLRGSHDLVVGTRHRFTLGDLQSQLTAAGFTCRRSTYANTLLFVPAAIRRLLSRVAGNTTSDVRRVPRWINAVLTGVLRAEAVLLTRLDLPFGLSAIVIAEKGSEPAGHAPQRRHPAPMRIDSHTAST